MSIGPDLVPPEICKAAATAIARAQYTQMLKLCLHGQEDLTQKGGKLVAAWKGKGTQDNPCSYRSLLISSHMGKCIHRTLRSHQATVYEQYMQYQQIGGRRCVPVSLGSLMTRSFLRTMKGRNHSAAIIFLDLHEAFYRLVRPLAIQDNMSDEALATMAARIQLPPTALDELRQLMLDPSAIEQAAGHWTQIKYTSALHRDTHFHMADQQDKCVTQIGSRPGDAFADVIFGYAFSRLLRSLEQELQHHDLIEEVEYGGKWDPFKGLIEPGEPRPFVGPCWMDDLAVSLTDSKATGVISKAGVALSVLIDKCRAFGMSPNLTPGKTELLLSLRGTDSRKAKLQFYGSNSNAKMPVLTSENLCDVSVVKHYVHLGGDLHHNGDCRPEVRRRLAIGHQAFSTHRRLLFHNPNIAWTKRIQLFDTLVLSKVLYGAETWEMQHLDARRTFHNGIIKLYKRLLKLRHDEHATDLQVMVRGNFIDPADLLRRSRLRFLVTLHRCSGSVPWGLLNQDFTWLTLIQKDLEWMHKQLHRSSNLKEPTDHFDQWRHIIVDHPGYWKRLVRRAVAHSTNQRDRYEHVRQAHQDIFQELQLHGHMACSKPKQQCQKPVAAFGCMSCQRSCNDRAGEGAHFFKRHGIIASHRHLFDSTRCPSCLKEFHTLSRVAAHLRYQDRCRQDLQGRNHRCVPAPGPGSRADTALERMRQGTCVPQQAFGPFLQPRQGLEWDRYHQGLYERLTAQLSSFTEEQVTIEQLQQAFKTTIADTIVSWTQCKCTLRELSNNFGEEEANITGITVAQFQSLCYSLGQASTWPFLQDPEDTQSTPQDLGDYENRLIDICNQDHAGWIPTNDCPRPVGKHRIFLHLFSGRRRPGDLQFYMDEFAQNFDHCYLHVISLDIVVDDKWGNLADPDTQRYWLHAARQGWIAGFLAGPPCNTFSKARAVQLHRAAGKRQPRVVRDSLDLWGFWALTLRELQAVDFGNILLCFSLVLFVLMKIHGGCGVLEHPAEPYDRGAASIWRLPLINFLLTLPDFTKTRLCQGFYGAISAKPTELLALRLPRLGHVLHRGMLVKTLPVRSSIGLNASGEFETTQLKEYPPALCRCLGEALTENICSPPTEEARSTTSTEEEFLGLCMTMVRTKFGHEMGPDTKAQWIRERFASAATEQSLRAREEKNI